MTAIEVHRFFKEYAGAFSRFSVDEIVAHWAYPAFMVGRGKQAALNEAEFRHNTVSPCRFYKERGTARAEKKVIELRPLTATTASARTADTLVDGRGEEIARWEHAYLLSETSDGLKVVAAMPDGELEAWAARGTPLGSW